MIFIDTPGIHKPKNKLGSYMTEIALGTFKEVDVILLLVDSPADKGPGDAYIVDMLKNINTPKILVINKIDYLPPDVYEGIYKNYEDMDVFDKILGTSALKGQNIEVLLDEITATLRPISATSRAETSFSSQSRSSSRGGRSTRNLNCKYTQTQHAVEHLSYPARFVFKILLLGIWYLSVKNDQIKS